MDKARNVLGGVNCEEQRNLFLFSMSCCFLAKERKTRAEATASTLREHLLSGVWGRHL